MPGKGGKYCVAGFSHQRSCQNASSSRNISMHRFPSNEKQRSAWTSFVRRHRPNWNPTTTSTLCSAHFLGSDFNQRIGIDVPQVQGCSTGSIKCKKFLHVGAVPTVDDFDIACKTFTETAAHVATSTTPQLPEHSKTSRAKRQLLREVHSSQSTVKIVPSNSENEELYIEDETNNSDTIEEIAHGLPQSTLKSSENCSIDVEKQLKSKLKTTQQRCSKYKKTIKRLQLRLKIARGNSTCEGANEESEEEYETHSCSSSGGGTIDGHVTVDASELDNYLEEADNMSDIGERGDDPDWDTLECGLEENDDADDSDNISNDSRNQVRVNPDTPVQDEPKFIVFLSCLVTLFSMFCFNCKCEKPEIEVKKNGTMVTVVQQCKSCKKAGKTPFKWHSQPFIFGRHPAGNLLLSFAVLVAGASITKVLMVFSHMRLSVYTAHTFFTHQRKYIFPTVMSFWESTRSGLIESAKMAKESVWAGDGRFDSMGHCAKYGAYTMLCSSIGKIVHFELIQANETGSSQAMELEGATRAFNFLSAADVSVKTFISDRHRGIGKWMRTKHPTAKHFFDIWHVSKSITKKLAKLAKEKGCEIVADWIKPIRNHLYWCACSTKSGYGKLVVAKWKSYARHISNIHVNHPDPLYKKCVHDKIRKRDWIKMGTEAYDKVSAICGRTEIVNDIGKLSSMVQTSQLEAFHSTLNQFHPKMICFSYTGTYCRHILAILHFNENVKREAKKAKDGKTYMSIRYPKYKNGEELVRIVPVPPTYNYVDDLRRTFFQLDRKKMQAKMEMFQKFIPGPLCSKFDEKLSRDAAIQKYTERKQMCVELYPSLDEQEHLEEIDAAACLRIKTKKTPCCKTCHKPMKGHPRGRCNI